MTTKRVLVVDDSTTTRMLIVMTLSKLGGFHLTQAKDGREAWGIIEDNEFDLILTDVNMPEMGGLELIKKIRDAYGHEPPIIVITTKGEESDRIAALNLGANAYLTKPVDGTSLQRVVSELLAEPEPA